MTEHHWECREPLSTYRTDLLVTIGQDPCTLCLRPFGNPQPMLKWGSNRRDASPFFLSLPIKPNELEHQLNCVGRVISNGHAIPEETTEEIVELSTMPAALGGESAKPETPMRFRLRQWPRSVLLAEPGRMRLASLLTTQSMSLDEMVFHSALEPARCERFLADMQAAGLLVLTDAQASQILACAPPVAATQRLSAQQERQLALPSSNTVARPGPITRLLLRLGIKKPTNS